MEIRRWGHSPILDLSRLTKHSCSTEILKRGNHGSNQQSQGVHSSPQTPARQPSSHPQVCRTFCGVTLHFVFHVRHQALVNGSKTVIHIHTYSALICIRIDL